MQTDYYTLEDSAQTRHGRNIADQIPRADAYGYDNILTRADVLYILDMVHTSIMDGNKDAPLLKWLSEKMDELHALPVP